MNKWVNPPSRMKTEDEFPSHDAVTYPPPSFSTMKKQTSLVVALLLVAVSPLATDSAEAAKKKPLQVFILAGQSNMVGHANFITVPTLFTAKEPEVRELAKLVFRDGQKVTRAMVDDQIATMIERNDLNQKIP